MPSPRKLRRELKRLFGCEVTVTNGKHLKLSHPDWDHCVYCAATPSDYRALRNVETQVNRARRKPQ